ncbi:MAG: MoaD/ThiS family protein [Anaerolineales bacterium]|jgi:sulfur carrier protein ThiS
MAVKLIFRKKEYEVEANLTVRQALKRIKMDPESVLATRSGELITEDEVLREGEEIKLVAVISGGGLH